ncbi:hypothetical protein C5167_049434 [Papaver somniferum]|uniref:Uncharacterized protein n=1 Tax=Papaver somniferum TaxID=3469 RepID=A0A4Y7KPT5_PAPSO|nr:hypothetical protein C5167_049434 [Papaver somniferum]
MNTEQGLLLSQIIFFKWKRMDTLTGGNEEMGEAEATMIMVILSAVFMRSSWISLTVIRNEHVDESGGG